MVLFVFEIICILLYGAASALGAYGLRRDHCVAARAAKGVYLAAVALHSAVIGMESVSTSGTLLSGPNIVMLASWVLAVVTAVGLVVTKRGVAFAAMAAPVVALLILIAQWLRILDPTTADNLAYYNWPLLVPHIVLVFIALACFATSAASAGLDLYQRRLMAARSAKVLELDTPALDTLSRISRLAGLVGLVVLVAAMLIGFTHLVALYAAMAGTGCQGNLSYLVPRVALSLVTTVVWSVFNGLSFLAPWVASAKVRDGLAIAGLVVMVLLVAVSAG
ncbi:hypothetical protein VJ923_08890 [Adlercreutzia sp. R25]|uniref:Cytochrome c assembly protein domain-containing protein n=1 Tax=Adlercreutzia shanghongiae TaxID=3111773 RepID=A0ABU6J036_9ACTN|nr:MULTISPECIES: hypothetical protein [unclassified Adlercreutzia]MEC4273271.1 hypothetical protein [Adlercreutzia sp. R25]MEC4295504.1 hypothetical protein [Adlercreutzia sp. R22]